MYGTAQRIDRPVANILTTVVHTFSQGGIALIVFAMIPTAAVFMRRLDPKLEWSLQFSSGNPGR